MTANLTSRVRQGVAASVVSAILDLPAGPLSAEAVNAIHEAVLEVALEGFFLCGLGSPDEVAAALRQRCAVMTEEMASRDWSRFRTVRDPA